MTEEQVWVRMSKDTIESIFNLIDLALMGRDALDLEGDWSEPKWWKEQLQNRYEQVAITPIHKSEFSDVEGDFVVQLKRVIE